LVCVELEERKVVDLCEDGRVEVVGKEVVDGVGAAGKRMEVLHEVIDDVCKDVTVN
jgi:hypothetical protein